MFDTDLPGLLQKIESDTISAIMWFDANYMKLNQSKCHFLFAGIIPEYQWAKVGEETIWESNREKLLGLVIDKKLTSMGIYQFFAKKLVLKLLHLVKIIPFEKKKLLLNH